MTAITDVALEFAQSRKVGFTRDRTKTVGASEIMRCMREVVGDKLGVPMDDGYPPTSGFAERGNILEDHWTAPLVAHWVEKRGGKALYWGQANQISITAGKLSATPDMHAVEVPRDILAPYGVPDIGAQCELTLELKSIDPRIRAEKLPKKEHVYQTIYQMGLLRKSTLPHMPDWGAVVYVNASDVFDVKVFPVQYSETVMRGLVARANRIMSLTDWNQAPPEGKTDGKCKECKRAKGCLGFSPWLQPFEVTPEDPKLLKEIKSLAKKRAAAETREAKAKAEVGLVEARLYAALAKGRTRFVKHGNVTVRAAETKSQNRKDGKKLEALARSLGATDEQLAGCTTATKAGTSLQVEIA